MKPRATLKELMSKGCVLAPCVYDCASARAVELSGFEAMMFSSGELAEATLGAPDMGLLSIDEIVWAVSRICAVSPLPMAVDIEGGFGGPISVFRNVERLVKAGAMAIQLEDEAPGLEGGLLPRKDYYAKVKAALAAMEGSDCVLIARTNADPKTELDEGIERCLGSLECGAHITTVVRLDNLKDATEVARRVPGWKMYPDNNSKNGIPEITMEEVYPLGYNLVTMHYVLKAAMSGMLEAGKHNFANKNNVWSNDNMVQNGVGGASALPYFDPQSWMELEGRFTGITRKFKHPALMDTENNR